VHALVWSLVSFDRTVICRFQLAVRRSQVNLLSSYIIDLGCYEVLVLYFPAVLNSPLRTSSSGFFFG